MPADDLNRVPSYLEGYDADLEQMRRRVRAARAERERCRRGDVSPDVRAPSGVKSKPKQSPR